MIGFTRSLSLALATLLTLALSACGSRPHAPTMPNGKRLAVMVILDRSMPPETPPEKAQQLQQVADTLEPDLVAVLRDNGYEAASITAIDNGNEPGRYILKVQILDYTGGSMAARAFIGWGAGKARLQAGFELLGPGGASYVKGAPSEATSRTDWRRTVRKVNQDIVAAVNVRLHQSL